MEHRIPMPDIGTTVDKIKLKHWLKQVGEPVKRGEPLVEVETDKATLEIESAAEGTLLRQAFAEGDEVREGEIIAIIGESETPPAHRSSAVAKKPKPKPQETTASKASWMSLGDKARPRPGQSTSTRDKAFLLGLYRRIILIRRFEERVKFMFLEGIMPGTIHQYQGQEAAGVGVCATLREGDVITSTHRPHGHCIARGMDIEPMMHELFGKSSGCCHGKGGSMHMGDLAKGVLPAIAIVGGNIPIATGIALSFKMRHLPNVAVCFMGDGATNEGTFHESLNMASIWNLPVVYVVENNQYAASTSVKLVMKSKRISDRAAAYGMPGATVDGNDVIKVLEATREAVERARTGGGPTLLELVTYRLTGHSRRDPCRYQPPEEREQWQERDPIPHFEQWLKENNIAEEDDLGQIGQEVDREIERAVESAMAAPDPDPDEALKDVFA